MTNKRPKNVLPIIVLCIIAVCVFASCTKKHVHDYGDWTVAKEATCEAEGLRTRKCVGCDETEQETIPATGHSYGIFHSETAATCKEAGVKGHYECSVCHKYFDEEKRELSDLTIAKAQHEYGEWVEEIPATCTKEGFRGYYKCSECGTYFDSEKRVITDLVLPKTSHNLTEWTPEVPATCLAEGVKGHYECVECHTYFDSGKDVLADLTIKKVEHNYGEWIEEVPATCTAEGVKGHYECSVCHKYFDAEKAEITDLTIQKTQHVSGEWIEEVSATCTAEGIKGHYDCSVCHKHLDEQKREIADLTIPKVDHDYGEWTEEIPSTCLAEGVKGHYDCSVCHKHFDEEKHELSDLTIQKAHVLNFVKGKEATCDEEGVKDVYRCTVCRGLFDAAGEEITDTVIPAKGHTYGDEIAEKAATETENGVRAHKDCLECGLHFDLDGNELDSLVIPASGHVYAWIEEVPATCEADGTKGHYECSHCSLLFDENYQVIEDLTIAHGHDFKFYDRIEATCNYDGRLAHNYCKNCGKCFDEEGGKLEDVVIEKLGHVFGEWIEEVPATCIEAGTLAHKDCERCKGHFDEEGDMFHSIEIPAHHDYTLIPEVAATCTTSGIRAYGQCSACNKILDSFGEEVADLSDLVIPEKGHSYGDWIEGMEATCTDMGLKGHYHCARCDKDFDDEEKELSEILILPLEHVYTTDKIIPHADATCTADGVIEHFECENCHKFFDADGKELGDVVIEKTGHSIGKWIEGDTATCTEPGTRGRYECATCSEPFSTIDRTKTLTEEELKVNALGHRYEHHDEFSPTCEDDGMAEHYFCDRCVKFFDADKNETEESNLTLKALGHDYGELIAGTAATETELATVDHYECSVCHKLFDGDKDEILTIYIEDEATEHVLQWIPEVSADCTHDGVAGHYECDHCDDLFDKDYKKVGLEDLTLPAKHDLGELVPASKGKCDDPDVLVSYYFCSGCYKYFTEDMKEIDWDDLYFYANRHNFVCSQVGDASWHSAVCSDCGWETTLEHEMTYTFYTEDGEDYKIGHCDLCGYDAEPEVYEEVVDIVTAHDFYIGYHDVYDGFIGIKYKYHRSERQIYTVMSTEESERFEKDVKALKNITEPVTKSYAVSYDNYSGTLEITFRPYKLYGVVTERMYYQQGQISSLDEISFVFDSNYTRDTKDVVYAGGRVYGAGGFDANYDFASAGTDEVIFTVAYVVGETSYDVEVKLVASVRPSYFSEDYRYTDTFLGQNATIGVVYTDGEVKEFELTTEMIVKGSFDPSVLGIQTFTVSAGGLIGEISVTVRDPHEIHYLNLRDNTIEIGDSLYLEVVYLNGERQDLEVTPDMIVGKFDNTVAGFYEISIVYGGVACWTQVNVIDPDDGRINYITDMFNRYVWGVDADGNVVPNLDYLYVNVQRMNRTSSYVKVTEDMISYDEIAAKDAYLSGGTFEVTITYYGKTTTITVAPRNISELTATSIRVYDVNNLYYGNRSDIYMKDGDLKEYFVQVRTENAAYLAPLAKDMIYVASTDADGNEVLVPFDFASAQNGKGYEVVLKYMGYEESRFSLLVYTESDADYSFSENTNLDEITVGTREEVLAQLAGAEFSLNMHVCNHSSWVEYFSFDDVIVGKNDDVDFSKPGRVWLEVSYKGIVGQIMITLVPNVEGVEKTTYSFDGRDFTMYANGCFSYQYSGWGTYALVNEELNVYSLSHYDYGGENYVQIGGEVAREFRAEMLGGNLEEYSLYTLEGLCTAKIYTKNGFSMADIYDGEGYYQQTTMATFSVDGKSVRLLGIRYEFRDNAELEITAEGNVVYRYREGDDGNVIATGTFNDNGKFYLCMAYVDEDGNVVEEAIVTVFDWAEKDGVITLYENGIPQSSGRIVDGYFVFDIE